MIRACIPRTITRSWWSGLFILLIIASCGPLADDSSSADLHQAVETAFESWAAARGEPYSEVEIKTLDNDGAFATVQVVAQFRSSASSPWEERVAEVDARKVGDQWQVDAAFAFTPTRRATEASASAATRTAGAPAVAATNTIIAEAMQAADAETATFVERARAAQLLITVSAESPLTNRDDTGLFLPVELRNDDTLDRSVEMFVELQIFTSRGDYPIPGWWTVAGSAIVEAEAMSVSEDFIALDFPSGRGARNALLDHYRNQLPEKTRSLTIIVQSIDGVAVN